MDFYANKIIEPEDKLLFQQIKEVISLMPNVNDLGDGRLVSCHLLARGLAEFFPSVKVVDGYYFRPSYPHSWLETDKGNVIDSYPIGILGGPFLVSKYVWKDIYFKYILSNETLGIEEGDLDKIIEAIKSTNHIF